MEGLKPNIDGVKWGKPDKLHVTLKFLGEVDESRVEELGSTVGRAVKEYSSFKMNITSFGGFPRLENPRVLFVGLSVNEELSKLHSEIQQQLGALGFQRDGRQFIPHITIGRVKKKFGIVRPLPVPEKSSFMINRIGIIESVLHPGGSVHTPMELFDLAY